MTHENAIGIEIDYEYDDCNNSKRPKMTSKVWEEMQRIQTTEGSKVLCRHCGKLLQDNCGTSHLKRHLVICPKRPKRLDAITRDSMASGCFRGPSSARESGLNTVLMVRPLKIEPESQVPCFFPTSNNRVPTIASTENVSNSIQELHAKTSSPLMLSTIESPKNQGELTLDDVEMKAFYASLDAETSIMSPSQDTTVVTELFNSTPSEETKKALKTLQDLLSKDFTDLLHTGQSGTIKSSIEHLAKLSADDGISAEMRLLILEVSREFTRWSCDYNDANRKIESANANIMKADKLEENLEANKKEFKEVSSLENELSNQLSCLEKRKKELEEQINAIKANISVFQSAKVTSTKRKREAFEEAKILKAQRDELKEQVPHLKNELEVAKKNQAHIRAEWSKLGEKFNKSLNGMNHEEKLDGKSIQENSI